LISNFERKVVVQIFCTRRKLGFKKFQAKDFEIENLEINILTQNSRHKENQRNRQKREGELEPGREQTPGGYQSCAAHWAHLHGRRIDRGKCSDRSTSIPHKNQSA